MSLSVNAAPTERTLFEALVADLKCELCPRLASHLVVHGECTQHLCREHAGNTALVLIDPRPVRCCKCHTKDIAVAAITLRAA